MKPLYIKLSGLPSGRDNSFCARNFNLDVQLYSEKVQSQVEVKIINSSLKKARNPKSEIRNKFKIRRKKGTNAQTEHVRSGHFLIRASDLFRISS
jgi:hypothetical protein